jgi:hypothetical protein
MKTITLEYPITVDNAKLDKLNMRRPKVRDTLAADKSATSDADKELIMFSNLCEITQDAILEMDVKDYIALQDVYSSFLS